MRDVLGLSDTALAWLIGLRLELVWPSEHARPREGADLGGLCERHSSRGFCSGDAEVELALLSRSSSLFFSFLPSRGQHGRVV